MPSIPTRILQRRDRRSLLSIAAVIGVAACMACADAPQAASPTSGRSTVTVATATQTPATLSGILTYVTDGQYTSVPAADPARPLAAAAVGPEDHDSAHYRPTTALSPDGRYEADVLIDEQGTRIDLLSGGHVALSIPIAAADGIDLVADPKGIARAVEGVPITIAWSPDSQYLAYGSITGAPWALNVFSVGTWNFASYQVEGGYVGELAWSPDSTQLAISTYELERTNHTVLLLDMQAGAVRRLIGGCIVVWSPDGNFVAVRREPLEEPGVWIAPIAGGTNTRVTSDSKSYPVAWTSGSPSLTGGAR